MSCFTRRKETGRQVRRDDRGQVTAFVVVMVAALILCAGLVIDGGLALAARVRAQDEAQSAARAGAEQINLATYRASGTVVLDPAQAVVRRRGVSRRLPATAVRSASPATSVTVTVEATQPTQILGIVGLHSLTRLGHGQRHGGARDHWGRAVSQRQERDRLRELATGSAAAVALVALVAGVPLALSAAVGWPLPHHLPSLSGLRTSLTSRGIPDRTLLDILACVAWVAWASVVLSIVEEALATVRVARPSASRSYRPSNPSPLNWWPLSCWPP